MNVFLSPNINKESVRIDPAGNIINAKTKEIIEKNEPEETFEVKLDPKPEVKPEVKSSKIDEMINKKIEELVARKIEEALKNL
jgi:hypothetical protein